MIFNILITLNTIFNKKYFFIFLNKHPQNTIVVCKTEKKNNELMIKTQSLVTKS